MKLKVTVCLLAAFALLATACQGPVGPAAVQAPSDPAARGAYGASDTNIVMLEGFHWLSSSSKKADKITGNWYAIVNSMASRIAADGFNMIWMPPVSDSGDQQGYMPRQLSLFTNQYGPDADHRTAVATLKNTYKVVPIADIVINHRVGTTDWADFTNPSWGATKTTNYCVVSNDEWSGSKSINYDTGYQYPVARDLDHKNPTVQNGIKSWLAQVKGIGYQGWRYDMVIGYTPNYIGIYNDYTSPVFSVGENWDDSSAQNIVNWIDGTNTDPNKRSAAFDFPFRRNLREAVVNGHYSWLGAANSRNLYGVVGIWAAKAVTFLENHDTEEARNGVNTAAFPDGYQTLMGYAVLLTHPGTPQVFWKDVFDRPGTNDELNIKQMIAVRKNYGIQSTSAVWVAAASENNCYAAYVTGTSGEIAVKIGPGSWQPSGSKWTGNKLLYSGTNWAIWGDQGKIAGKTWP